MNKEAPYRKRAEQSRKRIDKNERFTSSQNLPSRNKVHGRKKNKRKIKYPIIRLLLLFFVLLPISIYGVYHFFDDTKDGLNRSLKSSGGYERVIIEENIQPMEESHMDKP